LFAICMYVQGSTEIKPVLESD